MQTRSSINKGVVQPAMRRSSARNSEGWSLVATMILMVVITMFVSAMWAALLPAYMHVINLRYKDAARAVNETVIDTTLASLNYPAQAVVQVTKPQGIGSVTSFQTNVAQGNANYSVQTTLTNEGYLPPSNCIFFVANRNQGNIFYLLQSAVTKGTMTRNLSVLLDPLIPPLNQPAGLPNIFGFGPAYSAGTTNEVGLACINGYNLPAGWTSPYQFADTFVVNGVTWQVGNGSTTRAQVIAGSQFEFWQPAMPNPPMPKGTVPLVFEPFTQIMGNVYSNYTDQNGANGNGYWMRNQLSDVASGTNVPGGSTANANVFGATNGTTLNGVGVPTGVQAGSNNYSIPIPQFTPTAAQTSAATTNGTGSTVNTGWGYNAVANQTGTGQGNWPTPGTSNGGSGFQSNPYTGGYVVSPPAPGQSAVDNWVYPAPNATTAAVGSTPAGIGQIPQAPSPPQGVPAPAAGGLGVPSAAGTYFNNAPQNVVVNGGTLNITSTAVAPPANLSVNSGQTVNIPPGNYNFASLQVTNGGAITVDPQVQGQTQFFMSPQGNGAGVAGAVYVDNASSINMNGMPGWTKSTPGSAPTGFSTPGSAANGQSGFGNPLPSGQPAVNTASPIADTGAGQGTCMNLVINTNASCNMLFAGNTRALIDAPSANVNVGYQPGENGNYNPNSTQDPGAVMANNANFYGSIISGNTTVVSDYSNGAGAYLHYDTRLKQWNNMGSGQPATFGAPLAYNDPWMFASPAQNNSVANTWQAVSWQEQLLAW